MLTPPVSPSSPQKSAGYESNKYIKTDGGWCHGLMAKGVLNKRFLNYGPKGKEKC